MGSNYPLKGCKGTYFEGGVRSLAFVNGGILPDKVRGKATDGFIHIADWYTTFSKLAGVDPSDSGPGKFPVDGLDVWPIITGENITTPHEEIMLGYNFGRDEVGAIIMGDYKLIVNKQFQDCDSLMWSPLHYPCVNGTVGENCDPYCLYNIVEDQVSIMSSQTRSQGCFKSCLSDTTSMPKSRGICRIKDIMIRMKFPCLRMPATT